MVNVLKDVVQDALLNTLGFFWVLSILVGACSIQAQIEKIPIALEGRGESVTAPMNRGPKGPSEVLIASAIESFYSDPHLSKDRNNPLRL